MIRRSILVLVPVALLVAVACGSPSEADPSANSSSLGPWATADECIEAVRPYVAAPTFRQGLRQACNDELEAYQRVPPEVLAVLERMQINWGAAFHATLGPIRANSLLPGTLKALEAERR